MCACGSVQVCARVYVCVGTEKGLCLVPGLFQEGG